MLTLGEKLFSLVSALWDILEAYCDLRFWRADWDRTWSPVSFFLALFAAVGLVVLVAGHGAEILAGTGFLR